MPLQNRWNFVWNILLLYLEFLIWFFIPRRHTKHALHFCFRKWIMLRRDSYWGISRWNELVYWIDYWVAKIKRLSFLILLSLNKIFKILLHSILWDFVNLWILHDCRLIDGQQNAYYGVLNQIMILTRFHRPNLFLSSLLFLLPLFIVLHKVLLKRNS